MKKPRTAAATVDGAPKNEPAFESIRVGIECLFFVRTRPPIDPIALVLAICNDAKVCDGRQKRRSRFVNRLTPIVAIEKANITGVEEVARRVLAEHFQLVGGEDQEKEGGSEETAPDQQDKAHAYSVNLLSHIPSLARPDNVTMSS